MPEEALPDALTGIVVSHTHWDRAWYLPFERFRVRLVRLAERLVDLLERDPAFCAFTLDGQTVLLEDVLDVRPDLRPRLEALVRAGRLVVGPFYVLPDLFLVSFESLVRNLQRGFAWRDALGAPDRPVGYVPDPFGQPEVMPLLLRGFGLTFFFCSRGADARLVDEAGALFRWASPDGSSVTALYGRDGYFNAAGLGLPEPFGRFEGAPLDPDRAVAQMAETAARLQPLQPAGVPLLLLNGFDHMPEQPGLPALLDAVRARQPGWTLRHGTLADLAAHAEAHADVLAGVTGDLLGNAHHPVLSSVYSARLYLKRAHHAAEHLLTHVAEPLAALLPAGPDPRPLLDLAWRHLLRAQPHDDLCGCSVDAAHRDTEALLRHARETATEALRERLETLVQQGVAPADAPPGPDVFVFNPHPYALLTTVEADVLVPNPGGEFSDPPPLRALRGVDGAGQPVAVTVLGSEAPTLRNHYGEATWGRLYRVRLTLTLPPVGYTLVRLFEADAPDAAPRPSEAAVALARALVFEWTPDRGDLYSFSPVPGARPVAATLVGLRVRSGAVRARYQIAVPVAPPARVHVDNTEAPPEVSPCVMTLHATLTDLGAAGVTVRVRYRNRARNGRLRVRVPTGMPTPPHTLAGAHIGLTRRPRPTSCTPEEAPARYAAFPGELDYRTQPSRDFVLVEAAEAAEVAGVRAWVAHRGLPEYELVDVGGMAHVAVTLCRSVGFLSVKGGRIRRVAAGPGVPTPGGQCLRRMGGDLLIGRGTVTRAAAMQHARAFAQPAWALELPHLHAAPAAGAVPRTASAVALGGGEAWLMALRPTPGVPNGVTLRLANPTDQPQPLSLDLSGLAQLRGQAGGFMASPADLHERWDDAAARRLPGARLAFTLAPHAVATWLLRPSPPIDAPA